eukprot:1143875-Pelagomonas_calceolata.AAC.11
MLSYDLIGHVTAFRVEFTAELRSDLLLVKQLPVQVVETVISKPACREGCRVVEAMFPDSAGISAHRESREWQRRQQGGRGCDRQGREGSELAQAVIPEPAGISAYREGNTCSELVEAVIPEPASCRGGRESREYPKVQRRQQVGKSCDPQ